MDEVDKKGDLVASGAGENDIVTIPKKRGRPAKPNPSPKKPSGRGRGRPPKIAASTVAADSGSDDEFERGNEVTTNGRNVQSRDRPLKASASAGEKPKSARVEAAKVAAAAAAAAAKKVKPPKSDEELEELERPKASGVGRGRPKKNPTTTTTSAVAVKRSNSLQNGSVAEVPKKRGRPSIAVAKAASTLAKATPSKANSGKSRGRPKKLNNKNDDDCADSSGSSIELLSSPTASGKKNKIDTPKSAGSGNTSGSVKGRGQPKKGKETKEIAKASTYADDSSDESVKSVKVAEENNAISSSSDEEASSADNSSLTKNKDEANQSASSNAAT